MRIGCFHNFLIQKRGAELAFMNMVIGLSKKGNEIGKLAREFVINNFTWEKCFDNLNKNLKGLI